MIKKKIIVLGFLICTNLFSMVPKPVMTMKPMGVIKGPPAPRATGKHKDEFFKAPISDKESEIESVFSRAPSEIKSWVEKIKQNKKNNPILLYGPYGVGKSLLSRALAKKANCGLCHIGMIESCRFDYNNGFDVNWLKQLDKPHIVVVDNITNRLWDDDIENLEAIVKNCDESNYLHLLMIAYKASTYIPRILYEKFERIKFALPDMVEIKNLFDLKRKNYFVLSNEIDNTYLENFFRDTLTCTPRDIEKLLSILSLATIHETRIEGKILLCKHHFDKAKERIEEQRKFFDPEVKNSDLE